MHALSPIIWKFSWTSKPAQIQLQAMTGISSVGAVDAASPSHFITVAKSEINRAGYALDAERCLRTCM